MIKIGDCVSTPIGNGLVISKEKNVSKKKNPMLRWGVKLQSLSGAEFNKIGDTVYFFSNQLQIIDKTPQTQLF